LEERKTKEKKRDGSKKEIDKTRTHTLPPCFVSVCVFYKGRGRLERERDLTEKERERKKETDNEEENRNRDRNKDERD
jgi:hypothetical protein